VRVAVLTLTRERLEYTKHCFARLHEFAGCPFDHYVLDQGSEDGTWQWLMNKGGFRHLSILRDNVGISAGVNRLLDRMGRTEYDVVVKFDNDCELTQPNTLRDIAQLVKVSGAILSPRILGLRRPPAPQGQFTIEGELCYDIPQIGGIFLAAPGGVYQAFRNDETNNDDDVQLCWWHRGQGGRCGYVARLEAWHYESTDGQWARYPEYFERRVAEGGRAY
jgi:GT2 family glycosyltransferase